MKKVLINVCGLGVEDGCVKFHGASSIHTLKNDMSLLEFVMSRLDIKDMEDLEGSFDEVFVSDELIVGSNEENHTMFFNILKD